MGILVNAHLISKSFSARPLFKGLSFSIESDSRIGLIGPNGAGKSTLLRILASQMTADDGTLSFQRGTRVGFLEQTPQFREGATLFETVLEKALDPQDGRTQAYAQEMISKFELDSLSPQTPIKNLSGGWQKRIALARELVMQPDLLLLDEPTNHLDVESILWLESLLARARFATLTITHDRLFLQRIANRIIEINPRYEGGLLNILGDYAHYLESRNDLLGAQERREIVLKNTLRRETEWLKRGAKARTTKQQARIQRHGELSEEVEDLATRNQSRVSKLDFQSAEKNPRKLISATQISKNYGKKNIFSGIDLVLSPGTRLGILGKNGAGKSTLIQVLLGVEPPTTGTVTHADALKIAYFDQTRDALDPEVSVLKTLCPSGDFVDFRGGRVHIRSYLDRFLFSTAQMEMKVGRLSGGEQSRILLARLMLTPANVLVLDEPTNDLDMATLTILEECLQDFNGAIILVTHDRYFLDQVANQILAFHDHKITKFADLSQWEAWHETLEKTSQSTAKKQSSDSSKNTGSGSRKKLSYNEQREYDSMEENIRLAEVRLGEINTELERPEIASNAIQLAKLTEELQNTQSKIEDLYIRWAELEQKT